MKADIMLYTCLSVVCVCMCEGHGWGAFVHVCVCAHIKFVGLGFF